MKTLQKTTTSWTLGASIFNLQSYKTVAVVVAITGHPATRFSITWSSAPTDIRLNKAINNFTLLLGGSNSQPLDSKSHTGFARKMVGGKLYDTPTSDEGFDLLKSLAITSKCIGRLMMQVWNHLVKINWSASLSSPFSTSLSSLIKLSFLVTPPTGFTVKR